MELEISVACRCHSCNLSLNICILLQKHCVSTRYLLAKYLCSLAKLFHVPKILLHSLVKHLRSLAKLLHSTLTKLWLFYKILCACPHAFSCKTISFLRDTLLSLIKHLRSFKKLLHFYKILCACSQNICVLSQNV